MKRTIAAILALSFLTLTACGSMPERLDSVPATDTAGQTETTDAASDTDTDTEADTTKNVTTKKSELTTESTAETSLADTTVPSGTGAETANRSETTAAGTSAADKETTKAAASATKTIEIFSTAHAEATTTRTAAATTKAASSTGKPAASTTTKTTTAKATTTKASTKTTTTETVKETTAATTTTPEPVTEPPTEPPTEAVPQDGVTKIVNSVMVVNSGTNHPRALELFSGNYNVGTRYAQTLNSYKAALGDAVNVWCMVVPTSQAFYTPEDVAAQYGNQLDHYNNICANLSGVTGIPVYDTLNAHKGEAIYSRTDYHWQPLAAYYAAEQFAAFAGVPYAALDTYTPVVRDGYVGAFYRVNKVSELGDHPEQFTYYKPANLDACTFTYYNTAFGGAHQGSLFFENNGVASSYTVFVGSDECILEADTNVENDRVLVIFKDSYGNALVPFLTQSFSKIYLCDFRYFDRNAISFIQEVGATDLLFAMSTVAVCTSGKVDKVANNLTK